MRNASASSLESTPRPVVAIGNEYGPDVVFAVHSHRRAQLMYASSGVITVNTASGSWVVPPERAVWVPPDTEHSVHMSGKVRMRSLYITAQAASAKGLPQACCVVEASPLLQALLEVAIDLPLHYAPLGRASRVMQLLLDEVNVMEVQPLNAPMPKDPELARICLALLQAPGPDASIDRLAAQLAMSRSSFTRHFRSETGMSFGRWLQQARFLHALRQIASGSQVTQAALDAGYSSASAFTAAFRQVLGHAPSRYFSGEDLPRRGTHKAGF
ncbi:MAG: helix-turn-helix transcriptional regulator [Ramlibacter sp.]|nr:helix-turn-helix transcriptional regulator [Ramlibacter sp.]